MNYDPHSIEANYRKSDNSKSKWDLLWVDVESCLLSIGLANVLARAVESMEQSGGGLNLTMYHLQGSLDVRIVGCTLLPLFLGPAGTELSTNRRLL
mmetsp:Transcript_33634/g.33899  ORF Transcript_33634/g.33899 Transcript_33634/m.33899 type:complete len:96 (-) Transcript_33634:936-1223(-)